MGFGMPDIVAITKRLQRFQKAKSPVTWTGLYA
jgi:hypothetical protein